MHSSTQISHADTIFDAHSEFKVRFPMLWLFTFSRNKVWNQPIENVWKWYLTRKTVETWLNLPKLAKIDFSSPKSNKKRLKGNDLKKKGSCGYVWKVISATRVRSTTEIDSRDLPRAESRDWLGDKFCTPDQEQLIRDEFLISKIWNFHGQN